MLEGLSTRMMACVVKMLTYRASKDRGAIIGRQIAMTRTPTAQETTGNTISIRRTGRNTVSICRAKQATEATNKTIVSRVKDFFSPGKSSSCSPFGSSTKARDQTGLCTFFGRSFARNPSKMHTAITLGKAEIKGRAQLSKRAFTGSC
jgi:hypothetical protein